MVKTQIICTIGPASSSETVLRNMMLAGMDVCRLNFSHGNLPEFTQKINLIRLLNKKYRRRIKILGDLQGHRVRIGDLSEPVKLKKCQILWLTQNKIKSTQEKVYFDYQGSLGAIKNGSHIFIDDGNIDLKVIAKTDTSLKTRVITGESLKAHKGVNIPDARLEFGAISYKDEEDIIFCEKNRVEYIAQSFVRSEKDIMEVRNILGPRSACRIIAKIENREGIRNINEIIKVSDGIMVARGDMGISIPVYEVPVIQKKIIKKCNKAGKFVITATQMLESMTENHVPTRAEVSDVANAILDGTDYVMLSAETAAGKYPVESVDMMNNVIKFTEGHIND
jgi:pyruvate kinase